MQHNPVGWFEIYVQDMPRAKAFYGAVLGVEFESLESKFSIGEHGFIALVTDPDGNMIGLHSMR